MPRLNKYICSGFVAGLMALTSSVDAEALDSNTVTIFAGPQSLSPNETISVTVQTQQRAEDFFGNEGVELTYTVDGVINTLTGKATHGLTSFDVPAQDRAGTMKFSAKALGQRSQQALVTVVPGPPKSLSLQIKPSDQASMIVISSDLITDTRGNAVSDQALVTIQWKDETGLVKSQNTQLFNSRVYLEAKCPSKFAGELNIRAFHKTVQFSSSDISALCFVSRG